MLTTGIKDFKNRLSHYLSYVKKGEDIVITERGKVIARVVKESADRSVRKELHRLVLEGAITYPSAALDKAIPPPIEVPGRPVSEIVLEDRR